MIIKRSEYIVLFFIILIGVVLRWEGVTRSILYDEAFSYLSYATRPFLIGLWKYDQPNNHLFHTFLAHFSLSLFGNKLVIYRLPVFISGILLIPLTFLLWKRLAQKSVGVISAALVATYPILVGYSCNARGYIIQALLFSLAIYLATYLLEEDKKRYWVMLSIFLALALFTIPTMIYGVGIVYLWILLSRDFNKKIILKVFYSSLLTVSLTLLFYIPAILFVSIKGNNIGHSSSFIFALQNCWGYFYSVLFNWNSALPTVLRYLFPASLFFYFFAHKKQSRYRIPLLIPVLIWPILAIIISRIVPEYVRLLVFLLPLFLGFISMGIYGFLEKVAAKFNTKILSYIIAIFLCLIIGYQSYLDVGKDSEQNALTLSHQLKSILKTGDLLGLTQKMLVKLDFYSKIDDKSTAKIDYLVLEPGWQFTVIQVGDENANVVRPFTEMSSNIYAVVFSNKDKINMLGWLKKFVPEQFEIMTEVIPDSAIIKFSLAPKNG